MIPSGTPPEEIVIVVVMASVVAFVLLAALFWFSRPRSADQPKTDRPLSHPSIAGIVMSRLLDRIGTIGGGATVLANPEESGLQGVAMERNAPNDPLAGQALGAAPANDLDDITPAEARAIIRQQARAEAIVAILKAAEAGKVKSASDSAGLIEAVSGAARTSRPGSPYTHLKTVVDDLRGKPKPQYRKLDADKRPAELSQAGAE